MCFVWLKKGGGVTTGDVIHQAIKLKFRAENFEGKVNCNVSAQTTAQSVIFTILYHVNFSTEAQAHDYKQALYFNTHYPFNYIYVHAIWRMYVEEA